MDTAVTLTQVCDEALSEADAVIARHVADRRRSGRGGRRAIDRPRNAWSTGQIGFVIGMGSDFVLSEIAAGEIKASRFGTTWRVHSDEVRRYLVAKGWPLPAWMRE